jgi:hypothetical protein
MVSPYYPNQVPWTDKKDWVSPAEPGDLVEADHVNQLYAEVNAIGQDVGSHKSDYTLQVPYAVATGSANTYAVILNPAPASYAEGMAIAVKINVDNTGASTINVNGLGAKAIKKPNGSNVAAGNLKAGSIYSMRYNGTNFILQGSDAAGNATPGDVLSGKTFTNDSGEQTGTMTNQGAKVITPGTTNKTIPAGYHNGSGYVVGDADLIPGNIASGKNIFGVNGSLAPSMGNKATPSVFFANRGADDTDYDVDASVLIGANNRLLVGVATFYLTIGYSNFARGNVYLFIDGVQVFTAYYDLDEDSPKEYNKTVVLSRMVNSGTKIVKARVSNIKNTKITLAAAGCEIAI